MTGSAPVQASFSTWVVPDQTGQAPQPLAYEGPLRVMPTGTTTRPGEVLPLLLMATEPGLHAWVVIEHAGGLDTQLVELSANARVLELPVQEHWLPGVHIHAFAVRQQRLLRDQAHVEVEAASRRLQVNLNPADTSVKPGESTQLKVEVKDHLGRPVAAEVALAVYDAALEAIQKPFAGDLFDFFYSDQRPSQLGLSSSLFLRGFFVEVPGPSVKEEASEELLEAAPRRSATAKTQVSLEEDSALAVNAFSAAPAAPETRPGEGASEVVVLRHDFRSTALWAPAVRTDAAGKASVALKLPDSTTRWKAVARAVGLPASFGTANSAVTARLPLTTRLHLPRFMVAGDSATFAGVLSNQTGLDQQFDLSLQLPDTLSAESELEVPGLRVPAGGSKRQDFTVLATSTGTADLTLIATATEQAQTADGCGAPRHGAATGAFWQAG